MYHVEIYLKDVKDATKLPPQHIVEGTTELVALVLAEQLGKSQVYFGERTGGSVDANGHTHVERMSAVWVIIDAAALDTVFPHMLAVAASIAEAAEQLSVSCVVVDVKGRLHCKPRPQQVALAA